MSQTTTRLVEINRDVSLRVAVDGDLDGAVAVLVGGLLDAPDVWEPLVPLLREQRAIVRISCRGCADSAPAPESLTISDLAGDVLAVADTLGIGSFDLVGVSMGGLVAQEVALGAPDRVTSLAIVSSAPWLGENGRFVLRLIRDLAATGRTGDAVRLLGYAALGPDFLENQPVEFEATARAVEGVAGVGHNIVRLIDAMLPYDSRSRIGDLRCPMTSIVAVDDLIFAAACSEAVIAHNPRATLTRMTGGHCAFQTSPGIAAGALLDIWGSARSSFPSDK